MFDTTYLSRREHSTSQLCSIHHDIPVTLHTWPAYGQWSAFDHNGDKQSVVLWTGYGIWWHLYGQFEVGWLQPLQLWLGSGILVSFVLYSRYICVWRYARVGNSYGQVQFRSINMVDAEQGEFRLSWTVSTRHLVRRPYCGRRDGTIDILDVITLNIRFGYYRFGEEKISAIWS